MNLGAEDVGLLFTGTLDDIRKDPDGHVTFFCVNGVEGAILSRAMFERLAKEARWEPVTDRG